MNKGIQVRRVAAMDLLDNDECVAGYMTGFKKQTCPDDATYSFRHGWRNGMCDAKARPIDDAQKELVADFVAHGRHIEVFRAVDELGRLLAEHPDA